LVAFVARRLAQAMPLLLAVAVLTFLLIELAPGDPIVALAGEDGDAAYYAMMRDRFGLDRPLGERFAVYLGRVLRGDLGFSYRLQQPAVSAVLGRLPATLLLIGPALLLSTAIGLALGVLAARRPHSLSDTVVSAVSLLGHAVPVFWLAQMLLLVFAYRLEAFPVQGMRDVRLDPQGLAGVLDVARHMVLPVTALTVQFLAPIARVARASLIDVLGQDYVRTAVAKGLQGRAVVGKHALRNALLPVVTVIGAQVGFMFSGAVLTETVFAWPGLGRLLLSAMLARDLAIVSSMFLLLTVAVVVSTLLVDLLYAALDPRIRYG
jgi:peptide/nickel transport system permease protein